MVKNIANKSKNAATTISCTADKIDKASIVKPAFVPIKDKIEKMKMEQQSNSEKNEFEQRFKEVTSAKENKNTENANIMIDPKPCYENESNGNHLNKVGEDDTGGVEELDQPGEVKPPKPMPRTSRNNSVSDQLSICSEEVPVVPAPRPVARPRTTATGYKV